MPDDPLAGLGLDRTVIMPVPGGRTAPARAGAPAASAQDEARVLSGLNPLVAAANPLLNLITQIRVSEGPPNPLALRESLAQEIRRFEAQARAAGVATEIVVAARYALCTLVDETAGSTPWGASGAWAQHGLLALFHNETEGGEKFFQLMARLAENPQANIDLLELTYVCVQFGLEGRFRVMPGGNRELEAIRQRLLQIIRRQRGEYERDLSPSWRGLAVGTQARASWLPVWVVGAVAAAVIVALYLFFSLRLSGTSDSLASDIAALRVAAPAAPRPAPEKRLAPFLAEEIRRGLVRVEDRVDRSVVTILGDGLFKPGEVNVAAPDQWLVMRIAEAMASLPGQVEVIGHTDNVPIRTLRFPSNWELSRARAEGVGRLLSARVDPQRIRADGRGDAEPVEPNDTPQGRARNRRVEITLFLPAAAPASPPPARPRTP